MKAYWITRCHVHNPHEYDEYIKLAGPAINKHGGTFLVRGGEQIELEGGSYERTVLVEFNSMNEAKLCYESSDYQEALKYSLNSSNRHVVLVEGVN
jgi:uncharacterized protein (DUF1330 family)